MRKSKIAAFSLSICLLTAAIPAVPASADVVKSGECGENLTWTLDNAGTLTISGGRGICAPQKGRLIFCYIAPLF